MTQHVEATAAPDQIAYLDAAAGTAVGLDYKQRFRAALDLSPGHAVVDIGCGPGTDLGRLADAVGETGTVIGVDREPRMVAEARRRFADRPTVEVRAGDVHHLPLAATSVDRARTDRVLQHVDDPAAAITQVRRVLRPGGVFGMAEPDWDSLVVAEEDVEASRRFSRFVAGRVRNPTVGREVARLSTVAGFEIRSVEAFPVVFRDFQTADQVLGLRRNSARAVEAGVVAEADAAGWIQRLRTGPFLAGFTLYLVTAQA
ncbi:methyltransferase domain-containing protein [Micromonospora sp. DT228]|uniref:methyltransferase domain-containing protein n=1 Tax=Micromonospora sp. DT228 TaxID=3393443 RepID=UPI003CF09A82